MKTYAPIVDEDNMEKQNKFDEVVDAEKQLWALIHSKELLRIDVQDLYRKARSGYEDMILNDHEVMELQDVEYCLWKLHYKHIDEFRRRIRQFSGSAENKKSGTPQDVASVQNSIDDHLEGFKSFLSEASEFYKDLIRKIKKSCGLHEELLLDNKDDSSFMVEPTKFLKCQYTCHRLLVCLGDLARYRELCQKSDNRNCKWSVAASYYFEAIIIFPDAWDNLMLLFEKDIQRGLDLGLVSPEVLQKNFDLEQYPLISELTHRFQGFRERLLEDSKFLHRLAIEEAISITTTLLAQYGKRKENFFEEIDYVITDTTKGIVVDFFTV